MKCAIHYKALPSSSLSKTKPFWPLTVPKLCQNSFLRQSALTESSLSRIHALIRRHFVCPPVDFLKSLSLHLQLHLRILLEDVRVALSKQPNHPFVGHAAGAQSRCVSRAQVVDPKVGNSSSPKCLLPCRIQGPLMTSGIKAAREKEWSRS